jgi:SAM-dependent methyltransferase
MRVRLLKYIRCPICKSEFELKIIKENNTEIEEGILSCKNCKFPAAITEGVVNLLFNLDADTLKEVNAHIKSWHEMFEKELEVHSEEEVKKSWAYVEQESSKDYGIKTKKIFKNAIAEANINKNSIILDLGAGTGWSTAQLAKISDYCIAVDLCKPIKLELSEVLLKNENFFFERCMANMMQLPFADECIDVVITIAALHHATYLEKSMYEISRVLKDKGKLILGGEAVVLSEYFCTDEECINAKKGGI